MLVTYVSHGRHRKASGVDRLVRSARLATVIASVLFGLGSVSARAGGNADLFGPSSSHRAERSEAIPESELDHAVTRALDALDLALQPSQVGLLDDYVPLDPHRLPWVRRLLREPLDLPASVDSYARRLETAAGTRDWLAAADVLGAALRHRDPGRAQSAQSPRPAGATPSSGPSGLRADLNPKRLGDAIATIDARVRAPLQQAFASLPPDTLQWVFEAATELIEEEIDDPEKDLFTLEQETEDARARQDRLLGHLWKVDRDAILAAGREGVLGLQTILQLVDAFQPVASGGQAMPSMRRDDPGRGRGPTVPASPGGWGRTRSVREDRPSLRFSNGASVVGNVLAYGESASGPWVVGGADDNHYSGAFTCIVDLGGNDIYTEDEARSKPWMGVRYTVDLAGNDRYLASVPGSQGAGHFSVSVALDVEGDDVYAAHRLAQGAGYLGCGWLIDLSGIDTYTATTFVQGAGFFGTGCLVDAAGSDSYDCGLYGQGFGYPAGIGCLLDQSGNDTYGVTSVLADLLRHGDGHAIAFNQGAGYGLRPDVSGGIGILIDREGHDKYQSDTFGQATSYYYGLGVLVDRKGHDVYDAFVYAQGAGVHYGVSALLDQEGNDRYLSKGVSQGCGHDLAAGWLVDMGGEDVYVAADLSQGAGNANGFGILFDRYGDDQYVTRTPRNTQGYGNPRRGSGSLGWLLDGAGDDAFLSGAQLRAAAGGAGGGGLPDQADEARHPQPEDLVEVASRLGARLDLDAPNPEEGGFENAPPLEVPDRSFTTQELFWMASTGQTRYSKQREFALEELGKGTPRTLRFLAEELDNRDARDQQTIGLIARRIGPRSVQTFADSLQSRRYLVRRMAARALGMVRDSTAAPYLLPLLEDPDWRVRYSVVGALGESGHPESLGALQEAFRTDPREWVRVAALGALAKLEDPQLGQWIDVGEADPSLAVRVAARHRREAAP